MWFLPRPKAREPVCVGYFYREKESIPAMQFTRISQEMQSIKRWRLALVLALDIFQTDFRKEVYSDLTGERGVLMGAIAGIMEAQYNLLRSKGHSPSEAFNETVEELSQSLMPLIAENGMDWMYANCSTTAQRGALDWKNNFVMP